MGPADNLTVLFRVSTDPVAGLGHLSRMLAFRRVFREKVHWFVDPGTKKNIGKYFLGHDNVHEEAAVDCIRQLLSQNSLVENSLIVCDSYNICLESLGWTKTPTVYFTDSDIGLAPKHVIAVNCQPGAKSSKCRLAGPNFYPIDTRGKKQLAFEYRCASFPISCLIGFGSADTRNITSVAIEALLSDANLRKIVQPICLLGPYFDNIETVEKLLKNFPKSKIIRNCRSLLDVPFDCGIAVGAPGISHAERLYGGMATVLVPQNDSHVSLCMDWQQKECALFAGPDPEQITHQINELISGQFKRAERISRKGQKLIDGKGASRILNEVISRVKKQ